jgi:cell division protein FtsL
MKEGQTMYNCQDMKKTNKSWQKEYANLKIEQHKRHEKTRVNLSVPEA